jgi:hypothetical protein
MTSPPILFLLVGHCVPDASMLRSAIRRAVPGASFAEASCDADLAPHRADGSVWIVNRALDGDFAAADGVELIAREGGRVRVALVSNFPEAQAAAVAAGAMPGFGKSSLNSEATARALAAMAAAVRA